MRATDKARITCSQVGQTNLTAIHKDVYEKWHKFKYHLSVMRPQTHSNTQVNVSKLHAAISEMTVD